MPVLFTIQLPDKLINELYAYNFVTSHKPHQVNHNTFRRLSYFGITRTYHIATMTVNDFTGSRTQ